MKNKKYYIETYGCQMNEYDSLIAKNILEKNNGIAVETPEQADVILINTCAIRENAHSKVNHRLNALSHLRKQGKSIAVLGCLAQNETQSILEHKAVDYVFGPDSFRSLPQVFSPVQQEQKNSYIQLSKEETYEDLIPSANQHFFSDNNKTTAFVSIQRGCDNFCTFCVVPFTRGRERSKSPVTIVEEVQNLADAGIKSVVLLGQNVNSYHHQDTDFTTLVEMILQQTKIELIYFTSPHPKDFPKKLIDLIAQEPRLSKYLHIPLQSGSNSVLTAMRRDYTRESFLSLIDFVRSKIPNVMISTDIIVGFPNESEQDFLQTLDTMEKAQFDTAFMFAYSERKGTSAQKNLVDNVDNSIKQQRLQEVIATQLQRSKARSQKYIGQEVEVLVEGISRRNAEEFVGKMKNSRKVVFAVQDPTENLLGKWCKVKIEKATPMTLLGRQI